MLRLVSAITKLFEAKCSPGFQIFVYTYTYCVSVGARHDVKLVKLTGAWSSLPLAALGTTLAAPGILRSWR